ncbi:MAG: NTP transferase domain-containing protein [Deltaproteobacteria bacterium]
MKLKSKTILLAAGKSTRMGTPKPLLSFHGKTLLQFQIEKIKSIGSDPIVVLGYHSHDILKAHPNIEKNCQILVNPYPEHGQFSSLLLGLKTVHTESVFVLPIDTPAPQPGIWKSIQDKIADFWVMVPKFDTRGGHPVLLSSFFVKHLLESTIPASEQRLDLQIKKLSTVKYGTTCISDPSILVDLDTPQDLETYFKCL